jgi:hypothetical protein
MRDWPGSALREAEALMAKRHAGTSAASSASDSDASPPVRVPILDVLGADELRLVVEALLHKFGLETELNRLRCCARAFRDVITNDDATRHVRKLRLGHPYRAVRAGFGKAFPPPGAETRFADLPRQVFVGRRPRPPGVTRFSQREAPYELEVMPPEGSDELRYINPIIVLDRSTGRFTEVVLLMDQRGLMSEIFPKW